LHRPRRHSNAERDEELGGNTFLAPRPILSRHRRNELLQVLQSVGGKARAISSAKQSESLSVSAVVNKRLRFHNG